MSSLNIHYTLLDVADELLKNASLLERRGDPESLAHGRARCLSALILACSSLEAWINVVAGFFYDGPGKGPSSWPSPKPGRAWHWHSLNKKWVDFASVFCGGPPSFTPGWESTLCKMVKNRNDLIAHFKGKWDPGDADARHQALTASAVGSDLEFARNLIKTLTRAYEAQHGCTFSYTAAGPGCPIVPAASTPPYFGLPGGPIATAGKEMVEPL